jgi:hypothetical protein
MQVFVVPLLDVRPQNGLQPIRRRGSVAPIVNRALRCSRPLHNLRGSPLQNKLGPAHGWTVKEKCGIRNFILDTVRNPHKDTRMSNTNQLTARLSEMSNEQLADVAAIMNINYTPESDLILESAMAILEERMEESDFIRFCEKLAA